jgi:hypothetical protein
MDEQSSSSKKLEWKWIAISFVLYLIFYLLPLWFAPAMLFAGIWIFGGIIIVAAVATYVSKGLAIVEPAIASAILFILIFAILEIFIPGNTIIIFKRGVLFTVGTICIAFILSFVGSWFGARAHKLWKSKSS